MNISTIDPISYENGYEAKTTFWSDFSIAELFGKSAIIDTYQRSLKSWSDDIEYLTELSLVLNHKIWVLYQTKPSLAELYNELWEQSHKHIIEHFAEDEKALRYYYQTTD